MKRKNFLTTIFIIVLLLASCSQQASQGETIETGQYNELEASEQPIMESAVFEASFDEPEDGTYYVYDEVANEALPVDKVVDYSLLGDKAYILGTSGEGVKILVYSLQTDEMSEIGLGKVDAAAIAAASGDEIWILSENKLNCYDSGSNVIQIITPVTDKDITDIEIGPDGTIYAAAQAEVLCFDPSGGLVAKINSPKDYTIFIPEAEGLTQEQIDDFYALINSVDRANMTYFITQLTEIIYEEFTDYYNDAKSVEEVSRIIQSKVQLYLYENS